MSKLKTTITEMIKHILTEVTQGEEEFAELEAARKNFVQNRGDDRAIDDLLVMLEKLVEPLMSEMGLYFEVQELLNNGNIVFTNDRNMEVRIDPRGAMGRYDVEVNPLHDAHDSFDPVRISLDSMKGVVQYIKDEFREELQRGGTYKQPPMGMVGEPEGQMELPFKENLTKESLRQMVSKVVVQELTTREQGKLKKGIGVMFRRVEPPDYKERKEYRGKWMGFTDRSRLDSMIEFAEGEGPDGQTFMKVETAELMLDI